MAIKTGLAAQFGLVNESVYGTAVTVTRFLYLNKSTIKPRVRKVRGGPNLGAGRWDRTNLVRTYVEAVNGQTEHDVLNKGFGRLLHHCLGNGAVAQVGVTTEYKHTIVPDTSGMQGVAASVQIGIPDVGGTVRALSCEGGKVTGFELMQDWDDVLKILVDWDFENYATGTALASASYASSPANFHSQQLAVTIGGTEVFTRSLRLKVDNGLGAGERRGSGQTIQKEPLAVRKQTVTGEIDVEFSDLTHFNAVVNGTQQALVATWTGDTIPAESNPFKLVATIAKIEFLGELPDIEGEGIVRMKLAFQGLYDGTNDLLKLEYHTTDTAL